MMILLVVVIVFVVVVEIIFVSREIVIKVKILVHWGLGFRGQSFPEESDRNLI